MTTFNTLPHPLDRACRHFEGRVAIIDGDRSLTYGELGRWSNRVANGLLRMGIQRGDTIGMLMPNSLEFVPTQHGVWKAGAALVQMPARASAADLVHFLSSSNARTLIYHADFDDLVAQIRADYPVLQHVIRLTHGTASASLPTVDYAMAFDGETDAAPCIDVRPGDLAYLNFTSGSTGQPKGVRFTHAGCARNFVTAGMEIGDVRPGEIFLQTAPLTHYAQIFLLPTLIRGGTIVLLHGMDVDRIFDLVEKHKVTATALVPTVIYLMLAHPRRASVDLSSLRTVVYAGSPMSPDRLREATEQFGQVFVQGYAGTEPGFISCLPKEEHRADTPEHLRRLVSAGRPLLHVDVCIKGDAGEVLPAGAVGEICTRQDGQMVGYLDRTKDHETLRDGWIHTGDLGFVDEEGYIFIVDRKKDMVVTGGFNVFPRQIEDVLLTHDAVAQCAVIGVPDDKWGEAVKAIVVLAEDKTVTQDELIALVRAAKGGVWAPKTVDFVGELPVNASGKLDKKAIRTPFWAGQERLVH